MNYGSSSCILVWTISNLLKSAQCRYSYHSKKIDITHRYLAVFHFRKKAFSNNGHVTMETKDPSMMDVIGEQKHLSKEDIDQINKLYKCDRM